MLYMYACMYMCKRVHVYMYVRANTHTRACLPVLVQVCVYVCM